MTEKYNLSKNFKNIFLNELKSHDLLLKDTYFINIPICDIDKKIISYNKKQLIELLVSLAYQLENYFHLRYNRLLTITYIKYKEYWRFIIYNTKYNSNGEDDIDFNKNFNLILNGIIDKGEM